MVVLPVRLQQRDPLGKGDECMRTARAQYSVIDRNWYVEERDELGRWIRGLGDRRFHTREYAEQAARMAGFSVVAS